MNIQKKGPFLSGIMRRIQDEGSTDLIKSIDSFPRPLRKKLEELVENGTIRPGDLESRVTTALRELPMELALEALDRYSTSALDTIRSKTGFMMGAQGLEGRRAAQGGEGRARCAWRRVCAERPAWGVDAGIIRKRMEMRGGAPGGQADRRFGGRGGGAGYGGGYEQVRRSVHWLEPKQASIAACGVSAEG